MNIRQDIQLKLLQEIDEICSQNNLSYILIGKNSLNAYLNHTIKNASQVTSIAMPLGDMERLFDIIEMNYSKNRYVERFIKNDILHYIAYGSRNTTDLNIFNVNNKDNFGIHIRISPIYPLDISKKEEHPNFILKRIYRYMGLNRHRYHPDDWDDIQNFSQVRISKTEFDSKLFSTIDKIEVDGIRLAIPHDADGFFTQIFGKDYRDIEIKPSMINEKQIIRTNKPFASVLNEIEDIIIEANELNDEIKESSSKIKKDKRSVLRLWTLVQMTDEQVRFIDYFKDKTDYLFTLDLNDEKEYDELYNELKPVIDSLKKYSKYGMTFSIDEKTDSLIEKILIMENEKRLINRIRGLSEKEYFVE